MTREQGGIKGKKRKKERNEGGRRKMNWHIGVVTCKGNDRNLREKERKYDN